MCIFFLHSRGITKDHRTTYRLGSRPLEAKMSFISAYTLIFMYKILQRERFIGPRNHERVARLSKRLIKLLLRSSRGLSSVLYHFFSLYKIVTLPSREEIRQNFLLAFPRLARPFFSPSFPVNGLRRWFICKVVVCFFFFFILSHRILSIICIVLVTRLLRRSYFSKFPVRSYGYLTAKASAREGEKHRGLTGSISYMCTLPISSATCIQCVLTYSYLYAQCVHMQENIHSMYVVYNLVRYEIFWHLIAVSWTRKQLIIWLSCPLTIYPIARDYLIIQRSVTFSLVLLTLRASLAPFNLHMHTRGIPFRIRHTIFFSRIC